MKSWTSCDLQAFLSGIVNSCLLIIMLSFMFFWMRKLMLTARIFFVCVCVFFCTLDARAYSIWWTLWAKFPLILCNYSHNRSWECISLGLFSARGSGFEVYMRGWRKKEKNKKEWEEDKKGEGYGLRWWSSRLITRCQNCQEQEGESNQGWEECSIREGQLIIHLICGEKHLRQL